MTGQDQVDLKALDEALKAKEVAHRAEGRVDSHEDLCALRYKGLDSSIRELKDAQITSANVTSDGFRNIYRLMTIAAFAVISFFIGISGYLYVQLQDRTHDRFTLSDAAGLIKRIDKLENGQ